MTPPTSVPRSTSSGSAPRIGDLDRRASRVALTDAGRRKVVDASATYEVEMATVLDATLSTDEQQLAHDRVTRLLAAATNGGSV